MFAEGGPRRPGVKRRLIHGRAEYNIAEGVIRATIQKHDLDIRFNEQASSTLVESSGERQKFRSC